MLVEQKREPQAEPELDDAGDEGIEERVEQREPRNCVAPQITVILEADPDTAATDFGVCEAEEGAQSQRVGQEHEQQCCGGQHEQQPEDGPVVECAGKRGLLDREDGHRKKRKNEAIQ